MTNREYALTMSVATAKVLVQATILKVRGHNDRPEDLGLLKHALRLKFKELLEDEEELAYVNKRIDEIHLPALPSHSK